MLTVAFCRRWGLNVDHNFLFGVFDNRLQFQTPKWKDKPAAPPGTWRNQGKPNPAIHWPHTLRVIGNVAASAPLNDSSPRLGDIALCEEVCHVSADQRYLLSLNQ